MNGNRYHQDITIQYNIRLIKVGTTQLNEKAYTNKQ